MGGVDYQSGLKVTAYSWEEIRKHNQVNDCWVVINGNVCDITQWLANHPGGQTIPMQYAGKDASEIWNKIHPRDAILIHAPWVIIGTVDTGSQTDDILATFNAKNAITVRDNKNKAEYTLEEVQKHNREDDAWVTIQGDVLNVTQFLNEHPGGRLVILNLIGKDATEEFLSIHPADVYRKHAPYLIIGSLKDDKSSANKKDQKTDALLAPTKEEDDWQIFTKIWSHLSIRSVYLFILALSYQVFSTLFSSQNIKFSNDRSGLTLSATFLLFFMIIHSVGNLHLFLGPDDFNGYGYFYARMYFTTGYLMNASIIEIYLAMAACLHVSVALKRTWDINRTASLASGKLFLAITGIGILSFMVVHLQQFRFATTEKYLVRPPPWYYGGINWPGLLRFELFWSRDESIQPVHVRDIYKLEFDLFQSFFWVIFYEIAATLFWIHACLGWQKLVPATSMNIPKKHRQNVIYYGWAMWTLVFLCYFSYPLYCYFGTMKRGNMGPQNEISIGPVIPGTDLPVNPGDDAMAEAAKCEADPACEAAVVSAHEASVNAAALSANAAMAVNAAKVIPAVVSPQTPVVVMSSDTETVNTAPAETVAAPVVTAEKTPAVASGMKMMEP